MTMLRWRTETWVFIIWNAVAVGVLGLLYANTVGSPCDGPPNTSACGMAGLVDVLMFIVGLLAVAIVWLIGLIVIGIDWWKGRGGKARDTSHAKAAQERPSEPNDSTQDAVLSEVAQDDD
jgi:hypothetical protein